MGFTDIEILDSIRTGNDARVIPYLYDEVLPGVKNFICKNSGNEEEAYDIFQDAIVLLYKQVKLNRFNESYKITGFLFTVCKNLWINRVKKKNRLVSFDGYSHDISIENNVLNDIVTKEKRVLLHQIFSDTGKKCLEILKYSIFENLSMEEICKKMGFASANAAKTQNYRCKQLLIEKAKKIKSFKELLLQ